MAMIGVCGNVVAQTVSNATKILTATIVPEVANVPLPSRSVGDGCESAHSLCSLALFVFGVLLCFSWLLLLNVVFWFCFPLSQAVCSVLKKISSPLSLFSRSLPPLSQSLSTLFLCVCVLFFCVFHHSPTLPPSFHPLYLLPPALLLWSLLPSFHICPSTQCSITFYLIYMNTH